MGGGAGRRRRARPRWSADGADKRDRPPPASALAGGRLGLDPGGVSRLSASSSSRRSADSTPSSSRTPPRGGGRGPALAQPVLSQIAATPRADPHPCAAFPLLPRRRRVAKGTRAFNAELAAARVEASTSPRRRTSGTRTNPCAPSTFPGSTLAASSPDRRAAKKKKKRVSLRERVGPGVGGVSPLRLRRRRRRRRPQPRGSLQHTWTESQRLHRAFKDAMAECWAKCRDAPFRAERRREVSSMRRTGAEPGGGCFRGADLADRDAHGVAPETRGSPRIRAFEAVRRRIVLCPTISLRVTAVRRSRGLVRRRVRGGLSRGVAVLVRAARDARGVRRPRREDRDAPPRAHGAADGRLLALRALPATVRRVGDRKNRSVRTLRTTP